VQPTEGLSELGNFFLKLIIAVVGVTTLALYLIHLSTRAILGNIKKVFMASALWTIITKEFIILIAARK